MSNKQLKRFNFWGGNTYISIKDLLFEWSMTLNKRESIALANFILSHWDDDLDTKMKKIAKKVDKWSKDIQTVLNKENKDG